MARKVKKGYEYEGWKLGEKVLWRGKETEILILDTYGEDNMFIGVKDLETIRCSEGLPSEVVYYKDINQGFSWVAPSELTKIDILSQARELLSRLTLTEAKELGISTETYENLQLDGLRWKPKHNEVYYFVDNGEVYSKLWENSKYDNERYERANCYQTKRQADKSAEMDEIDKIHVWIKNWAIRNDEGWFADWSDPDQYKWFLVYDYKDKEWYKDYNYRNRQDVTYMSESNAERLIAILNR